MSELLPEDREQLAEQIAWELCVADGQDPHRLTYHMNDGIQEPYGDAWTHYLPQAYRAIELLRTPSTDAIRAEALEEAATQIADFADARFADECERDSEVLWEAYHAIRALIPNPPSPELEGEKEQRGVPEARSGPPSEVLMLTPEHIEGETVRDWLARSIALHGLGTMNGARRWNPPNLEWEVKDWARRVLECIPVDCERRCYLLADVVLHMLASPTPAEEERRAAEPETYAGWQQKRGMLADTVDWAIGEYEGFMLDDDYNAQGTLDRIIARLREVRDLTNESLAHLSSREVGK